MVFILSLSVHWLRSLLRLLSTAVPRAGFSPRMACPDSSAAHSKQREFLVVPTDHCGQATGCPEPPPSRGCELSLGRDRSGAGHTGLGAGSQLRSDSAPRLADFVGLCWGETPHTRGLWLLLVKLPYYGAKAILVLGDVNLRTGPRQACGQMTFLGLKGGGAFLEACGLWVGTAEAPAPPASHWPGHGG